MSARRNNNHRRDGHDPSKPRFNRRAPRSASSRSPNHNHNEETEMISCQVNYPQRPYDHHSYDQYHQQNPSLSYPHPTNATGPTGVTPYGVPMNSTGPPADVLFGISMYAMGSATAAPYGFTMQPMGPPGVVPYRSPLNPMSSAMGAQFGQHYQPYPPRDQSQYCPQNTGYPNEYQQYNASVRQHGWHPQLYFNPPPILVRNQSSGHPRAGGSDSRGRDNASTPGGRRRSRSRSLKDHKSRYSRRRSRKHLGKNEMVATNHSRINERYGTSAMWCLKCHVDSHWTYTCKKATDSEMWKCSSFGLEDIACHTPGIRSRLSENIDSVGMLVHHTYDATVRLNYYADFVKRRDIQLRQCKKKATDPREAIDIERYPLARLDRITPFEAYASRSCRISHTLVRACSEALKDLLKYGIIDPLVKDGISTENLNAHIMYEENIKLAMEHILDRAKAQEIENGHNPPIYHLDQAVIQDYVTEVEGYYEMYTKDMDELYSEWTDLTKAYTMWREPLTNGKQVYNELPFHHFRIEMELLRSVSPGDMAPATLTIPTAKWVKVEDLRNYIRGKAVEIESAKNEVEQPDVTIRIEQDVEVKQEPVMKQEPQD